MVLNKLLKPQHNWPEFIGLFKHLIGLFNHFRLKTHFILKSKLKRKKLKSNQQLNGVFIHILVNIDHKKRISQGRESLNIFLLRVHC